MNKAAKNIGLTLLALLVLVTSIHLYLFREQLIDTDLIPDKFSYCGGKIDTNSEAYQAIVLWLNANKEGWRASSKTYAPRHVYYSKSYKINVMEGMVVVSSETDHEPLQFIKKIDHQLVTNCPK